MKCTEIQFDERGNIEGKSIEDGVDALAQFVTNERLTALIFHTHGFNNSPNAARSIGGGYFDEMQKVLDAHPSKATLGVCLVLWPSEGEQLAFGHMASRAQHIGAEGLAKVVNALKDKLPQLEIHLSGHSLGARLSGWTLKGLRSNVRSLFLIQGAMPSYAFAYDVLEVNPGSTAIRFVKGLFSSESKDLQGALATARPHAEFIGATFTYKDEMMWAYFGGALGGPLVDKLLEYVPGLGQYKPANVQSVEVPEVSTTVDYAPMGMLGMLEGKFQRLQMTQSAQPVGAPYTGMGSSWTSFDFTEGISHHDDFRKQEVAWAHLQLARLV